MNAPLHERLAEAARAAGDAEWVKQPRDGEMIYTKVAHGETTKMLMPAVGIHPDHEPWFATRDYLLLAHPANVAKLCEQVRVLLGAVQAVEDFISGKPDAPEPFGMTRHALRLVRGES